MVSQTDFLTPKSSVGRMKSARGISNLLLGPGLCFLITMMALPYSASAQSCTLPPSGIVSWWSADGNAHDIFGNGTPTFKYNDGTAQGSQGGLTFVPGEVGQAFMFDGTSGYVSVPSDPSLNLGTQWFADFWVNPGAYPPNPANGQQFVLLNKWANGQEDKLIVFDAAGKIGVSLYAGGNSFVTSSPGVSSTASLPLNTWSYVAVTYDGSALKIYINGALDTSAPATGASVANSNGPLYFGHSADRASQLSQFPGFFKGLLDEIEWGTTVPSDAQILAIYNSGSAGQCKPSSGSPGPTGPQGPPGATGPQGPTGLTGATGATGAAGPQGPVGPIGPQGPQGTAGTNGTNGTNGTGFTVRNTWVGGTSYNVNDVVTYLGSAYVAIIANSSTTTPDQDMTDWTLMAQQGATGPQGTAGAQGPIGPMGSPGATGAAGPAGPQGPQGTTGATGAQGPTGLTGATGATGAAGPQGPVGPIGPQGPQGTAGTNGTNGTNGTGFTVRNTWVGGTSYNVNDVVTYLGSAYVAIIANSSTTTPDQDMTDWTLMAQQGATGPQGAAGTTGATGPMGPMGAQGPQGQTGTPGASGAQGPAGPAGAVGPAGPVGPTGATGPAGAKGPAGPAGSTGPGGPTGPAGPTGPTGPAGPSGSQVWNTFLLGVGPALAFPPYTASTFTPDRAITVTRVQVQLQLGPSGCTTNAVLTISDGTTNGTHSITITGAANDSGVLALGYLSGVPIKFSLTTPSAGCKSFPAVANAVVQYKAM